jgi:CDP-2,3-bis-(O-geranylgeranyl)-sn-glycerol synthase
MLPAYLANMMPIFVKKINFLNYPVDFNKKLNKKPILGSHKTWRGFFFGTIAGIIIAYIQSLLSGIEFFQSISILDYSSWLIIGFLLGFGALLGDSVKSFFKRRLNIKPGKRFIPWDQLDYTIGSLGLLSIFFIPSWQIIITCLILNFILHILATKIGYYTGIRKEKW